jgi:hypothetical protein
MAIGTPTGTIGLKRTNAAESACCSRCQIASPSLLFWVTGGRGSCGEAAEELLDLPDERAYSILSLPDNHMARQRDVRHQHTLASTPALPGNKPDRALDEDRISKWRQVYTCRFFFNILLQSSSSVLARATSVYLPLLLIY